MDTKRAFLYILVAGFLVGICVGSFTALGLWFSVFLTTVAGTLTLLYLASRKNSAALIVALFLFAAALGVLRFEGAERMAHDNVLDAFVGADVVARGVVVDEPDERSDYARITVELASVNDKGVDTKALVTTTRFPKIAYGDAVAIQSTLERPENFMTDNGREFNYRMYLAKDEIFYTMPFAEVSVLSHGNGNPIKGVLFDVKHAFLGNIQRVLPEPHASLMGGLLLGAKESFSDELDTAFRETGIIHIVVLSGYNVTIVAEAIMRFFAFLPVAASFTLGAVSIVFFAIMTGASATIVRASIMALLVILARVTGRTHDITRALFFAGLVMVLHNPYIVAFDPSFQLSFLATLGLIWISPLLEKRFHLVPTRWGLREFATATIATQIFVLPLLLYLTGELSLVALPTNMLVLMFVPVTMLLGFVTGLIAFVSVVLAMPFAFLTFALLMYMLLVIQALASMPFASVGVPVFPFVFVVLTYVLYGMVLWLLYTKKTS